MKLQFWGAARTVTGSMHLVEVGGRRVLLDCGMYQGPRSFERNSRFPFDPASIDAVVLSHAHLDHAGNLPTLVAQGFRGRIHSTTATRDLCAYMLLDSAKIQEMDVERANRHRRREGKELWDPLYVRDDALDALMRFHTVGYGRDFEPVAGMRVHFRDAGHILGAAIVVVDLEEDGNRRRLLFSGDVGRPDLAILRDPQIAEDVDLLIMESTYGDREHEKQEEAGEQLRQIVESTWDKKGKLLVPAFALGRTQEIVYRLNELSEQGRMPPIDVYVDSPLAVRVTDVYRLHPECFDAETREALLQEDDQDPLGFRNLRYIRSVEGSMRLNTLQDPAVIISASGMLEGGRIIHHLRHHGEDPGTTILFVGYQAPGTLGRKVLEGDNPVSLYGREVTLRAKVRNLGHYSAHADRGELLDWAGAVAEAGDLGRIWLVHGEEESAFSLAEALEERGICDQVEVPERGQSFTL